MALRTKALESLLIEKGLLTAEAVDARSAVRAGHRAAQRREGRGARLDRSCLQGAPARRGRRSAELGIPSNAPPGGGREHADAHNMVVCTLCSCYPWAVLGLPPTWYKSFAYRSRAVIEPRSVLRRVRVELEETSRSTSGTAAPRCATWCCPNGPPAQNDLSAMSWPPW